MKLSKDELLSKLQQAELNDELKIELLEDVSDSFEAVDLSGYVERVKYDELKDKYVKRFTEGAVTEESPDPAGAPAEDEEPKEITYEDLFIPVE